MSDNLNQILASGYPQGSGSSARYVFNCPSCGAQIVTQNEYSTGEQGVVGSVLSGGAQSGLSSLIRWIPVVGPIMSRLLGGIVGSQIGNRQTQGIQQRQEGAKRQAFEEIRGRFSQCTRCGTAACPSCFSGGMCRTCEQTERVQQQYAAPQKGGPGGSEWTDVSEKGGAGDKNWSDQSGPGEKGFGGPGGEKDPTKMWEK